MQSSVERSDWGPESERQLSLIWDPDSDPKQQQALIKTPTPNRIIVASLRTRSETELLAESSPRLQSETESYIFLIIFKPKYEIFKY